ncbi:hypothetical protein F5Y05DRAFT_423256, partial [Hypoxylon sp. FL0543]
MPPWDLQMMVPSSHCSFLSQRTFRPDDLFADQVSDLFDEPADSLVCLYFPKISQGREFDGGVFYHQGYHRAVVFMHMVDYGYALPVHVHLSLWNPLETVLPNWTDLVRLGKTTASLRDVPALFNNERIGPWEWRPLQRGSDSLRW